MSRQNFGNAVITDEELVRDARSNPECFDVLANRLRPRLVAHARFLGKSPIDAEDLAQQTLVKFLLNIHNYDPSRARVQTYVFKILHNAWVDALKATREVLLEDDENANATETRGFAAGEKLSDEPFHGSAARPSVTWEEQFALERSWKK